MPQAVDSPTMQCHGDEPQDHEPQDHGGESLVILYSTGETRGYAGEIGIQMVTNNLNRERCKREKNRKYNL